MGAAAGGAYGARQDLREPLLEADSNLQLGAEAVDPAANPEEERFGCTYQLYRAFGWTVSKEKRTIRLDGSTTPSSFPSNKLNNQKYTIATFLPLLLYNEFKFFFNMFFLLIAASQFVPFLKVGLLITYVAPLVFVLIVTMIKEGYDDIQRYRRDQELNLRRYEKVSPKDPRAPLKPVHAKDIKVGDILKINTNDRIPADMLLL